MIKQEHDDGWAYCHNLTTQKQGCCPLACLSPCEGSPSRKQQQPKSMYSAQIRYEGDRDTQILSPSVYPDQQHGSANSIDDGVYSHYGGPPGVNGNAGNHRRVVTKRASSLYNIR